MGGYELRCKDVIDGLVHREHIVEVITTSCDTNRCDLHKNERNIHRKLHNLSVEKNSLITFFSMNENLRIINEFINLQDPDIIYLGNIIPLTQTLFPYLAEIKKPIVCDEGYLGLSHLWNNQSDWYNFINQKDKNLLLMRKVIKKFSILYSRNLLKSKWDWPDQMVGYFNSEAGFNFTKRNGVPTQGYTVIHSGLNLPDFPYYSQKPSKKPIEILLPGRFDPLKGQLDGVKLIKRLKIKKIIAILTLVGYVSSEDYYYTVLKEIETQDLKQNVTVMPMVNHDSMSNLYEEADFCFFPSMQKFGFSRVPLESMASGTLLISYGNEGSNEVIQNNETGFVVPEGDIGQVISILENMSGNPSKYQKISSAARKAIVRNHSMDIYIDKIENFLTSALHNS